MPETVTTLYTCSNGHWALVLKPPGLVCPPQLVLHKPMVGPVTLYHCGEVADKPGPWQQVLQLLVNPAAARVLDAAQRWVLCWDTDLFSPAMAVAKANLAAAVDALGDTTPDPETEAEMDATARWESKIRAQHPDMSPPAVRRGAHAARVLFGAPMDALGEPTGGQSG
jgi:hypothetical protein